MPYKHISYLLCSLLLILAFCSKKISTNTSIVESEKVLNEDSVKNESIVNNICPEKGVCTIKILKNKTLIVRSINNGILYELEDDKSKTVIQYEYSINQDEVTYDGGYREEVIFEIDNNMKQMEVVDIELQKTKMLYGRYCHCRGTAGLFVVAKGKLTIKKEDDLISLELNYNTNKIPQKINKISVKDNKLL